MQFVHLHTHSHYSVGHAVPSVHDLVRRAADLGMPALALTDYNSIAGMHDLVKACDEFGVQPIIGAEVGLLPSDHGAYQGRTHNLVLLVENEKGYRNLTRLLTLVHDTPADTPPHVPFAIFERFCEGLLVLSGSRRGELYHWLREKNLDMANNYLNRLVGAVGLQNVYFEIMEYPHPVTRKIMDIILDLAKEVGIRAVATQNVHFLDPQDMPAYCALLQERCQLLAPHWPLTDTEMPTRHFTTAEEMGLRFGFTPEIVEETAYVAQRCSFRFPRQELRLPVADFERGRDAPSHLWDRVVRGALERYGHLTDDLKERINEEYSDICASRGGKVDLAAYFLLAHSIIAQIREKRYCLGVGRGPLLTSVIAYCLGITSSDPLAHGFSYLPQRVESGVFPPLLIETSQRAMRESLQFLADTYGIDHVAAVGRRVDWERQHLFQHFVRWAGLPQVGLRQFPASAVFTPEERGVKKSKSISRKKKKDASSEFPQAWDDDVEAPTDEPAHYSGWVRDPRIPRDEVLKSHKSLARAAYTLHPCPREFDAERAQYALSKEPIPDILPVLASEDGIPVTQGDAALLDSLHIPRIRYMSFAMLNVLEDAVTYIRQESISSFMLSDIPLDDELTMQLLGKGLTNGIAPLHGITAKSLLRACLPQTMVDLIRIQVLVTRRCIKTGETSEAEDVRERVEALPDVMLSYWCAYLKAHYPVAFMTAMLTHSRSSAHKLTPRQRPRFEILLRETRRMNIEVYPPNINFSLYEFSQEHRHIRTGLMVVQGMGEKTYEEIDFVRKGRPFSSLADFCKRTNPKRVLHTVIVNLIKAGAFDLLCPNRVQMLMEFERALKNARLQSPPSKSDQAGSHEEPTTQLQLFDPEDFEDDELGAPDEGILPIEAPDPTQHDIMTYEQEAAGYAISHDLLGYFERIMKAMSTISPFELPAQADGRYVYVAGFIDHTERDGPLIDEGIEMIMDLEGFVVKVPPNACENFPRLSNVDEPVLVEGEVRKHGNHERHLVARNIYLMNDVAERAKQVADLRLDLSGENRKVFRAVRGLLNSFEGETVIHLENADAHSWLERRGVEGARVFFCPPLLQGLLRFISADRIGMFDKSGQSLSF